MSLERGSPGGCQKFEKGCEREIHISCPNCKASLITGLDGTHGLVDTGTWTDNICASQLLVCDMKHALQLLPVSNVGLLEDGFSGGLRMIGVAGDELLGFGAEGQVGEEDVAFPVEEGAREGEIDS